MDAPVTFFDRVKVAAVIGAIFLLLTGVANAFVDTSRVDDLIFHSSVFWVVFAAAAMVCAPLVLHYLPIRRAAEDRSALPRLIILGLIVVLVLGLVVISATARL